MTTDEKEKKLAKTHSSTIALVPPDEAWETVQALRYTLEDKGVYRWPPHVNLLYPFVVESHIPLALPKVRAALSNMEPFQVRLAEFGLFAHRRKSTLWLRPDTSPDTLALDRLQQALQDAVPECHEQRSNFGGRFSPHMTVTHLDNDKRSVRECEQLRDDLQASWQPVTFMCTEVHVMTRQGPKGQFRIRAKIFLGQDQEAGEALQDQAYAGMPSEAPPWCLGQINGGRAGDRGGRSKGKSRSRSSADDGKLLQKLQEADTVAEMAVLMTPVLGESRVSDLSAWCVCVCVCARARLRPFCLQLFGACSLYMRRRVHWGGFLKKRGKYGHRLSSGAYLVDEQGFILEDMHDRDVRTQVRSRAPFIDLKLSY